MARKRILGLGTALALVLSACAHDSKVAEHWGEAQRANVAKMIENPNGSGHADELDGATAEGSMKGFRRSQAERRTPGAAPSIINIGTGGR
jgi:hypothetical protein